MALPCLFEKLLPPQRPATVHCSTDPAKVHPSLIKAAVQTTARQQACVTASVLVTVCCSQKTTITSNSTLQHRCCQSASLTDESCCTDNSLTAGLWHCHVCLRSCCPHNDQQQCTAAQMLPKCIRHLSELLCRQQPDSRLVALPCLFEKLLLAQ